MSTAARPRIVAGLRLVRLVGRGGEGEVWEARDHAGRRRALKLIRPEALAEPREVAVRGRWLERIDHPALVRVHASGILDIPHRAGEGGELEGWGWAEMDFVEGRDLAAGPAEPDVLERLEPLAEALDLLHEGYWSDGVPLVHRDVKPANIVDTDDGRLVLVDPSTLRGVDGDLDITRVGTPLFVAPEVVTGRLGPAADVYSFAATAVALVTGARGRDLAALLAEPRALGLPYRLPWGVRAALSPDPALRPRTCAAVLSETDASRWLPAFGPGRRAGAGSGADSGADAGAWPDQARAAAWPPADEPLPGPRWAYAAVLLVLLVGTALVLPGGAVPSALTDLVPGAGQRGGSVGLLFAAHVAACLLGGASPGLIIAAPPVAWALVLADRSPVPRRRRALQRAMLTGAYVAAAAGALLAQASAPAWLALAAVATVAVPAAVETPGAAALVARILLLPLWAAGAAVWLAGAALLLLPAFAIARARQLLRAAASVTVSVVDVARGPA